MNQGRCFVRAQAEQTRTPYYYYPANGQPGAEGIKHEIVLSLPLTPPAAPEEVYGVLSCGSRRASSHLLEVEARARQERERRADLGARSDPESYRDQVVAINQACFEELRAFFGV